MPGFVDLQVNGWGTSLCGMPAARTGDAGDRVIRHGVTTWCPTLTTGPEDAYPAALERIEQATGSTTAGAHLEARSSPAGRASTTRR